MVVCTGRSLWLWLIALALAPAAYGQSEPPADPGTDCGWDFLCHMKEFLKWAVCFLFDLISPIAAALLDFLPEEAIAGIDVAADYVAIVNGWFPLTFGVGLLGTYYAFVALLIVIKVVLIPIPTIG